MEESQAENKQDGKKSFMLQGDSWLGFGGSTDRRDEIEDAGKILSGSKMIKPGRRSDDGPVR
jgi:hypothetical protein